MPINQGWFFLHFKFKGKFPIFRPIASGLLLRILPAVAFIHISRIVNNIDEREWSHVVGRTVSRYIKYHE